MVRPIPQNEVLYLTTYHISSHVSLNRDVKIHNCERYEGEKRFTYLWYKGATTVIGTGGTVDETAEVIPSDFPTPLAVVSSLRPEDTVRESTLHHVALGRLRAGSICVLNSVCAVPVFWPYTTTETKRLHVLGSGRQSQPRGLETLPPPTKSLKGKLTYPNLRS